MGTPVRTPGVGRCERAMASVLQESMGERADVDVTRLDAPSTMAPESAAGLQEARVVSREQGVYTRWKGQSRTAREGLNPFTCPGGVRRLGEACGSSKVLRYPQQRILRTQPVASLRE